MFSALKEKEEFYFLDTVMVYAAPPEQHSLLCSKQVLQPHLKLQVHMAKMP